MKIFDVLILGGGASGCFCAINCGVKSIAIVDNNASLAKKLLVTGNGRCNLTNTNCSSKNYNQDISEYLQRFSAADTIKHFAEIGLQTYADEQGRVYPISNTAKSVVDILNFFVEKNNVQQFLEHNIIDVTQQNDTFAVITDKETFYAKKVVVATGTSILPLLAKFDINISSLAPSLVALKTKQKNKRLDGVKVSNAKVWIQDEKNCEFGEVLFKPDGLSGICIFNLSCYFARKKKFSGKILIDLLQNISQEKIYELLNKNVTKFDKCHQIFWGLLHKEIANEIMYRSDIDPQLDCTRLTKKDLQKFACLIKNLDFDVCGHFSNNQIISGGIDLQQLNNFESKSCKNLYFCGEVCDVDGDCGGYNLQWAWTSGYLAAKAITKNN